MTMYAKEYRTPREPIRVTPPKNYGGTAFRDEKVRPPERRDEAPSTAPGFSPCEKEGGTREPGQDGTPCCCETQRGTPREEDLCDTPRENDGCSDEAHPSGERTPSSPARVAKLTDGGFGFEELLLVGLIFLLSQDEGNDDVLLILALLLFYK